MTSRLDETGSHAGSTPVAPSHDDPLVASASEALGGPLGRRARPGGTWWTPVRVLLAMVVAVMALGVLVKQPCRQDAWTTGGAVSYVHACYSDVPHMFRLRGLVEGKVPYFDHGNYEPLEYPVLIGAVMYATAAVARIGGPVNQQTVAFYDLTAILLTVAAAVTVVALARLSGRRPWDAALFALAPGLLLNATINWDLLAVMFTGLAMLAWAGRRPGLAGVLIGLGTATKLFPVLLLGALLVLCLRAGRLAVYARTVAAAVATWAVVNVPVMVASFDGWKVFYVFSERRGADLGSLWYGLASLGHPVPALNVVASVVTLVLFVAIALVALRAPRRPRLAQVTFLLVALFAVLNKVYSPQYVLWLIPLAALARPRWRDFLIWQAGEVVYFFGVWLFLAGYDTNRGLPPAGYGFTILTHLAATAYFVAMVVRDMLRPEGDPVRADGTDDPAGGVLAGAPDVWVLGRASAS